MTQRKEINLDTLIIVQEYNTAMTSGFLAMMIFVILMLTSAGAIWYRLDALKAVVGL